jgi:D-serine dehydratase
MDNLNIEKSVLDNLKSKHEFLWINDHQKPFQEIKNELPLSMDDMVDASDRISRFASFIKKAFPETEAANGKIESKMKQINDFQQLLESKYETQIPGDMYVKLDSHLPIAGSVKARGGIYEVLKHAEQLALENNMLTIDDNYEVLADKHFRDFFSQYSVVVGSTGNLGLSIGISSAKVGFNVTVHMSNDAKQWKKDLLRSHGVTVVEHTGDYSKAVETGRKQSDADPKSYFIDDENSKDLFLGYSTAAFEVQKQLTETGIVVDDEHPLFVYLPCGVGGAPGGITFGLKQVFGDNVHCFFVEPTQSPCMLLGLVTALHQDISVQEIGLENRTEADGLAVGRPSGFVGKTIAPLISGSCTVSDDRLFHFLYLLATSENIHIEPSAAASLYATWKLFDSENGKDYLKKHGL